MDADLDTLCIAVYCTADDLLPQPCAQSSAGFLIVQTGTSASGAVSSPAPTYTDMGAGCVRVRLAFRSPDIHRTSETEH